ncbi:hypothetical protein Syun_017680 [Stephania yunnanensis]|uniref:Ataxin-2 C-terminal domain-containing protein n=1 Tax=Stephania yunnanensis TaxID=152371 RepID=A0AAP0J9N4_9MAGN
MALVSGGRSTLNPNAPLFIPAALRQVEDFSPEWWDLVKSSTWFRDYWISEHQEEVFDANEYDDINDVAELLPESFDLGFDEEFSNLEAQFEDLVEYAEAEESAYFSLEKGSPLIGKASRKPSQEIDVNKALLNLFKSPKERVPPKLSMEPKYHEKPVKSVSPKCSPRRIQQPR